MTDRFATGGAIPAPQTPGDDRIPAILSPCLHTDIRPGETPMEATKRLDEGVQPGNDVHTCWPKPCRWED